VIKIKLSKRVLNIKESGTLKFTPIIADLRRKGKKIVDFAAGEPDFSPFPEIISATKNALDKNKTKYSNVSGIKELKEAIVKELKNSGLSYDIKNVLVSNGAKQALYNTFQTICNPGDEVIVFRPYWPTFAEQIKLAGAKPVFVDTDKELQLDLEKIKKAITKKTKAIIINSPNNPSGAVYGKKTLLAVCNLALIHKLYLVSDECYEMLVYDGLKHVSVASLSKKIKENTITIKSFSKSFSMTGFRIGFVVAEQDIIKHMAKLQGHLTGNVSTFSQYGALAAFKIKKKKLEETRILFEKRRYLAYRLAKHFFDCAKPEGAFYLFPNIKNCLNSNMNTAEDFSMKLLKKAGVAVVPGEVFGMPGHVRISYAASEKDIREGFKRIGDFLCK